MFRGTTTLKTGFISICSGLLSFVMKSTQIPILPRRAAPTRASLPPAERRGRASRRPCRQSARPPAPHHCDCFAPSRAARPRWACLTTRQLTSATTTYCRHHSPPQFAAAPQSCCVSYQARCLRLPPLPTSLPLLTIFLFCQLQCQVP